MPIPAVRRPVMTLYSGTIDPKSHGTRIVLFEKEIDCEVIAVDGRRKPQELAELNPYNQTPTMVDRDLVLYNSLIINEYLDERLPHPPLMPVDPVSRARARLMIMRFERDWYSVLPDILEGDKREVTRARQVVRDGLTIISPIFKEQDYALGTDFSLVDCILAPILWRLPYYGIHLPKQAAAIEDYAERLFERKSFQQSLTEEERRLQTS